MSFKVECWSVAEAANGWGVFRRAIELPFVPYPGLWLRFPEDGDPDGWEVCRVTWWAGSGQFLVTVEGDGDPDADWGVVRDYHLGRGWELEGEWFEPWEPGRGETPPWLLNCRGQG